MNKADRLGKVLKKKKRRIIGLMSGMSMDGVDLACADIEGHFPKLRVQLIGTHSRTYSREFREKLITGRSSTVNEISALNVEIAQEFAKCVQEFLAQNNIEAKSIDAIGSHGQTLFHSVSSGETHSTLQVGAPSIIAEMTGILTIGNFRVRDIAAGGRGAPLVSIADFVLFRDPHEPIVLNNLGSISNLTVVTPLIENMIAFDTGPANMAIDFYSRLLPNNHEGMDKDGLAARSGHCIPELLQKLLQNPFFNQAPPKAAGYAEFGPEQLQNLSQPYLAFGAADLLRTAVEFTALTLQQAYRDFVLPRYPNVRRSLFSGGGIYNQTLMQRIREVLPDLKIELLDPELADAKEALAFAILANETLSGRPGSLPNITGVHAPTVLGEVAV